jgi:hypothetical protein
MIKLLVSIASEDYSYSPGETVSLDAETEKRLIESGQAEAVKSAKAPKAPKND